MITSGRFNAFCVASLTAITAVTASATLVLAAGGACAQPSARSTARGAPEAFVEAVQMPAWVERGADKIPLAPGMALRDRDRVRTGDNARILLRMAEGSAVKLGEKGSLLLDSMRMQRKENVFAATMKVFEGAFRFTTSVLVKYRGRREVEVTISAVTAGIRGTDLWGKAAPDRDIVCLIEGIIEVRRGDDAPRTSRRCRLRRCRKNSSSNGPPRPRFRPDAVPRVVAASGKLCSPAWTRSRKRSRSTTRCAPLATPPISAPTRRRASTRTTCAWRNFPRKPKRRRLPMHCAARWASLSRR